MQKLVLFIAVVIALFLLMYAIDGEQDIPPLMTCTDAEIKAAIDALPVYQPSDMSNFISVQNGQLIDSDSRFFVRGINYYPAQYPWRRFLTQVDTNTVDSDLALLQSVELNTLRIFLWNEALFTCEGNGAVPVADAFLRLDSVIHSAASHGFRLIVTLNDMPDLTDYPLYENPPYILAQTSFIVQRYRDEAAILAWDLRNEGDIDYGTQDPLLGKFSKDEVLYWLAQTSALVRSLDDNHLITAGWLYDNAATAPYVDFVSLHHWGNAAEVQSRISDLQNTTNKPILLQEFGYSTYTIEPETQAERVSEVIVAVDSTNAAGWLIWTAFDFLTDATCIPPACPSVDNAEHHFGLWYADYKPKPAVDVLTR